MYINNFLDTIVELWNDIDLEECINIVTNYEISCVIINSLIKDYDVFEICNAELFDDEEEKFTVTIYGDGSVSCFVYDESDLLDEDYNFFVCETFKYWTDGENFYKINPLQ